MPKSNVIPFPAKPSRNSEPTTTSRLAVQARPASEYQTYSQTNESTAPPEKELIIRRATQ